MIPFLQPSFEDIKPNRFIFQFPPGGGTGGGAGTSGARLETQLPAAGTPEEFRLRLAALEGEVSEAEIKRSLENLKRGMELQKQDQEQEGKEVNYLLQMAQKEGGLDKASLREKFMKSYQQRLVTACSGLVLDKEISLGQLSESNIRSTFQLLEKKKGSIKVWTAGGERSLYAHEQNLFRMPGILSKHSNIEVKKDEEAIAKSMQQNVRLMIASAKNVGGEKEPKEASGFKGEVKKAWEGVKEKWNKIPTKWKTIAKVAVAVGLGLYLLNKIFRADSSGGESKKGTLFRILGLGALIAGGVYLYGRFMKVDEAWNKLKGTFKGLSKAKYMEGLKHYRNGDIEQARRAWGPHSDELIRQHGGGQETKGPTEAKEWKDEHGVIYTEPRVALKNYNNDLDLTLSPVTAFVKRHWEVLTLATVLTKGLPLKILYGGVKMTAKCLLGIARFLSRTMRNHPIISTMLIVAFAMKVNGRFPKDGKNLKKYVRTRKESFAEFLRNEGQDPKVAQRHLNTAADILDGKKNLSDFEDKPGELVTAATAALSETLRLSQLEKIRSENRNGLDTFRGELSYTVNEHPGRRQFAEKVKALSIKVKITNTLPIDDLKALQAEAGELKIKIEADGGYIWWGEADDKGNYLLPGNRRCIGIDPGLDREKKLSIEQQYEAAKRFSYNPNFSADMLMTAMKVPLEQMGQGAAKILERVMKGEYILMILDGRHVIWDGLKSKYAYIPRQVWRALPLTEGEFSTKELIFSYAEGIVPVTMVGITSSLVRLRNPFSKAGKWKLLAETALYPLRALKDLQQRGVSQIIKGMKASKNTGLARLWDGVKEMGHYNGRRVGEVFADMASYPRYKFWKFFNKTKGQALLHNRYLRGALEQVRLAEDAMVEGVKNAHIEEARELLRRGGVKNIADELTHLNIDESVEKLRKAIGVNEDIARGVVKETQALLHNTFSKIKAGSELAEAEFKMLRELARDASSADELTKALKLAGAGDHVDDIKAALRGTDESLEVLSDAFRKAGFLPEAAEGGTAALRVAGKGGLFDDAARLGRVAAVAEELGKAKPLVSSILDSFDAIRTGGNLDDAAIASLRQLAQTDDTAPAVKEALRRFGVVDDKIPALMNALKAEGSTMDDILRAFQQAEMPTSGRLRRALAVLKRGGELGLEGLSAIKKALSGSPDTPRFQSVRKALSSAKEFTQTKFTGLVEAFKAEGRLGRLIVRLRGTGLFSFSREVVQAAPWIDEAIKAGRTADWIEGATKSADWILDGRSAPWLTEGADTTRAVSEVAEATRAVSHLDEALAAIKAGTPLTPEHLGALKLSAEANELEAILKNADIGADEAAKIARLLKEQKHLGRLIEGLEGTKLLKIGQALKGALRIARFIPHAAVLGGGALNIMEANQQYALAQEFRNNPEVKSLLTTKAVSTGVAGILQLSVDVGLWSAKAATYGRFAVMGATAPLIIITFGIEAWKYMINGALEAQAEIKMKTGDYKDLAMREGFGAAGIKMPKAKAKHAYEAIKEGRELRHEEFAALRAEAVDDEDDAIEGLTGAGISEAKAKALVKVFEAVDDEDDDEMIIGLTELGISKSKAETMVYADKQDVGAIMLKALKAAGIKLTKEPQLSRYQAMRITHEARIALLHRWYTTGEDTGAGEAYSHGLSWNTSHSIENYIDQRGFTRLKLLQALIKMETGEKPDEYNLYRTRFVLSKTAGCNIRDIQEGEKLLAQSRIFADTMINRKQVLTRTFEDGFQEKINLSDAKYDADSISIMSIYSIFSASKQANETPFKKLVGEKLFARISKLDPNYLNYSVNVMRAYLYAHLDKRDTAHYKKINQLMGHIQLFIQFEGHRHVPDDAIVDPDEDMAEIEKVMFDESLSEDEVINNMGAFKPSTKGVAALYVYACALGYTGTPNLGRLQLFFIEAKKGRYGIYWNPDVDEPGGGEWVVNEEGEIESDNECGSNPDLAVLKIIKEIRDEPDDILSSRFDYITDFSTRDDEVKRTKFMLKLADMMELAYKRSSAPAKAKEWGDTTVLGNLLRDATGNESLGDAGEFIEKNTVKIARTTRRAVGYVLTKLNPLNWF